MVAFAPSDDARDIYSSDIIFRHMIQFKDKSSLIVANQYIPRDFGLLSNINLAIALTRAPYL